MWLKEIVRVILRVVMYLLSECLLGGLKAMAFFCRFFDFVDYNHETFLVPAGEPVHLSPGEHGGAIDLGGEMAGSAGFLRFLEHSI